MLIHIVSICVCTLPPGCAHMEWTICGVWILTEIIEFAQCPGNSLGVLYAHTMPLALQEYIVSCVCAAGEESKDSDLLLVKLFTFSSAFAFQTLQSVATEI